MKKLLISTFIICFFSLAGYTLEEHYFSYNSYDESVNTVSIIVIDMAKIHQEASEKSKVLATLKFGSKVFVGKKTEVTIKQDGIEQYFYEITYIDKEKTLKGFIWGGALSMVTIPLDKKGENYFVLKYTSHYEKAKSDEFGGFKPSAVGIILFREKIKATQSFELLGGGMDGGPVYSYSVTGILEGNHTFTNVQNVIIIKCLYSACGYTNGDIILFYTGDELIHCVDALSVSEAGVFHFETKTTFPDDKGGKKNCLTLTKIESEFNDKKENYDETKRTIEEYIWDGKKISKSR